MNTILNRGLQGIRHHFEVAGLLPYLEDEQVTELMLNPDGKLWIERHGEPMQHVGQVESDKATRILNALSDHHQQTVTPLRPILECELPIDGSRFEGLVPPLVARPSFVIRKKATQIFTLSDYVRSGAVTKEGEQALITLVRQHRNIVVVGGTGSGKTTFVNALLHQMSVQSPNERLIILEDTNELQCFAPNHVIKRTHPAAQVTMNTLLRTTLRYRPDRIIVGEVRGAEALALLKAWNTGHAGGVATIHADSARQGLSRLEQCVSEASPHLNQALIGSSVHALAFMGRNSQGQRVLKELVEVSGFQAGAYQTRTLYQEAP